MLSVEVGFLETRTWYIGSCSPLSSGTGGYNAFPWAPRARALSSRRSEAAEYSPPVCRVQDQPGKPMAAEPAKRRGGGP